MYGAGCSQQFVIGAHVNIPCLVELEVRPGVAAVRPNGTLIPNRDMGFDLAFDQVSEKVAGAIEEFATNLLTNRSREA